MQYFHSNISESDPASFGRYKVSKLLGEGAMGRVYLAEDPVLDRPVAIKVIAVEKQPDNRTKEEYLKRFNLEAKACAKLSHPSIVAIFDAGEESGLPWIAFEYVDGDQLEELLQPPNKLPIDKIVSITIDITSALHHAHECGIIHRDIKPANILIDKRTHIAKLADFGVVKAPWVALTQDGTAVGSPGYMSPEQLEGSGTDSRCDLFSLGIVLYQMLTGKHPFLKNSIPATIFATLHSNYSPVNEHRPDTPAYLSSIVDQLLVTKREKRIQTAAHLLHKLREGSRSNSEQASNPLAFDKEALLGNTTRLKRISHILQNLRKKGAHAITSSRHITSPLHSLNVFLKEKASFLTINNNIASINNRKRIVLSAVFSLFLFTVAAVILLPRFSPNNSQERVIINELRQKGFSVKTAHLIDTCNSMIENNHLSEAKELAGMLTRLHRTSVHASLLLGKIALLEENDLEAAATLSSAAGTKQWRSLIEKESHGFIAACAQRLSQGRVDSALINSLATTILLHQKDSVLSWTKDTAYWLRWNSIMIAQRMELPVDMVEAYILDLQHAGSVRTRTRAATRLAELGDTRAIAPLKIAANKGFRDPVVSYTARLVLEKYFKESTDESAEN